MGIELLQKELYKLEKDYSYLKSINIHRLLDDLGSTEYTVEVVLSKFPYYEGESDLVLGFVDAKEINIGAVEGMYRLLTRIEDVSSNQWEGIKYKVKEESGVFSLCCRDIIYRFTN